MSHLGDVKLTDFGLARFKSEEPNPTYTKNVATRWYRPPEVLFGGQTYDESVDVWALGCVLFELLAKKPLFKGEGDIDQLTKIFEIMGNIDVSTSFLLRILTFKAHRLSRGRATAILLRV